MYIEIFEHGRCTSKISTIAKTFAPFLVDVLDHHIQWPMAVSQPDEQALVGHHNCLMKSWMLASNLLFGVWPYELVKNPFLDAFFWAGD